MGVVLADSASAQSDPASEFTGSFVLGTGSGSEIKGLWGDGDTLWTLNEGVVGKVFAYELVGGSLVRNSGKDFSVLDDEGSGVDSDNELVYVTDIFVGDDDDTFARAYTLSGARRSGDDINISDHPADSGSSGFWSNGTILLVSNSVIKNVSVYLNGVYDSSKNFKPSNACAVSHGVWSDGETLWVVASHCGTPVEGSFFGTGVELQAYRLSDFSRDSVRDIPLGDNNDPKGLWGDGETLWVGHDNTGSNDEVFYYKYRNNAYGLEIAGRPHLGQTLSAKTSGIKDFNGMPDNPVFSYQWQYSDGTNIPGATNPTYNVTYADLEKSIRVKVTFTDKARYSESLSSAYVYVPDNVILVSNIKQDRASTSHVISGGNYVAQEFTAGSHSNGYNVSSIVVRVSGASSTRVPVVSIYSSDGTRPSTKLFDFNGSVNETGNRVFTAPANATLSPDTSYFFHVSGRGSGSFSISHGRGSSTSFDTSSSLGWSMSGSKILSGSSPTPGFLPRFAVFGIPRSNPLVDVNRIPVFSGSSNFSVSENVLSVGAVVVSDPDSQDSVTGYSVSGGVDRSKFLITSGGLLSFKSAPNFESPGDNGGDNVYDLEVTVNSGAAGRERFASMNFSVVVADVLESPFAPGAPGLTPLNATSLFVNWDAPDNIGPVITDYDVEYSLDGVLFSDWDHTGRVRRARITDLAANTSYYVRVRAVNDEGEGAWSGSSVVVTDLVNAGLPASSRVLVSNIAKPEGVVGLTIHGTSWVAQEFTTGSNLNGYTVSKIVVDIFASSSTRVPVVSIYSGYTDTGGVRKPEAKLFGFTGLVNATGHRDFTVPVGVTLSPDTSYFFHVSGGSGSGSFKVQDGRGSPGNSVDGSSAPGWGMPRNKFSSSNTPTPGFRPQFSVHGAERSGSLPDVNTLPAFSSSSTFTVFENNVSVGVVVAEDSDGEDSVTGYSISGVDGSLFSITNQGVLTFDSAPNFESAVDVGGDNVYNLVVRALSGSGDRLRNATQAVTVEVRDVSEAPSRPGAPILSSPTSTSLGVAWSAPGNTGPAIKGYDVGYRSGSLGSFSDWSHSGNGTSTTITGLTANTLYEVRVRAINDEGTSVWSQSGSVTTLPVVVVNTPPSFSSSSTFTVQENNASVGTVVASDGDSQDSVTGYSISGGVDSARFSITGGGVLTFVSAPNFESAVDVGGNNEYNLVVRVTSGTGGRVRSATQSIVVSVDDVAEAPSRPGAPVLSSPSSTSLRVVWSAPSNTGPPVNDYDVQYRAGTTGSFSNRSHSGTSRTSTITGLSANTLYEVRVRASNAEGTSSWSQTASFTTGSVAANSNPVFTSSSSFSVNENVRNVGTVTASDSDGQDSITGYGIWGGVDGSLFSITNQGVLTFDSVPDFESPVDYGGNNVYNFVVRATSGSGDRRKHAFQSITVTVDNVTAPSTPDSPSLSSSTSSSLSVTWSAPSNTGPAIDDYDVQYRQGTTGSFSNQSHTGTSRSTTITGLTASTAYQVRVRASNAEGNSGWSQTVSFSTGSSSPNQVTNNAPVFTSISSFSVNENSRSVGTVVASDSDSQDSVTGYSVSGGVDRVRFSITGGGVLTFVSAPNFESAVDVGGNNEYNLVVRVTSGTGGRVRSATQSIVVSVDDVAEAPSRPGAPVLSSPSSTSLRVVWSAPSNTGPPVNDYDVQYRAGTTGSFSNRSHSGTSRTSTITGLSANTLYEVRVRASNAEGTSGWSQVSSFTTGSSTPPPVTNNPPSFTSSSSFFVNENSRSVGTVVAFDGDGQDSVTGYSVSGGVDSSRFSITNAGVLTFNSAPNYESPADVGGNNEYNLVVTARSGTGGRVRSATQSIVVSVDDVAEGVAVVPSRDVVLVYTCG